jgi:hypothetical protein
MAQGVGRNILDARETRVLLHDEPESLARQAVTMMINKEWRRAIFVGERTPTLTEILNQRSLSERRKRERTMPLIAPVTLNFSSRQINAGDIKSHQF